MSMSPPTQLHRHTDSSTTMNASCQCHHPHSSTDSSTSKSIRVLVLFARLHFRVSVDDANAELIRQFQRARALLCRQSVTELRHVTVVVHQQHLQISGRFDEEFVFSVGFASVSVAFGGTVPDVGHLTSAVPSAADARVDTARFPPRSAHALEAVRVPTDKALWPRLRLLLPSSSN